MKTVEANLGGLNTSLEGEHQISDDTILKKKDEDNFYIIVSDKNVNVVTGTLEKINYKVVKVPDEKYEVYKGNLKKPLAIIQNTSELNPFGLSEQETVFIHNLFRTFLGLCAEKAYWFMVSLRMVHFSKVWIRHYLHNGEDFPVPVPYLYTFIYKEDKIEEFTQEHLDKVKIIHPLVIKLLSQHNKNKFNRIANSVGLLRYSYYQQSQNFRFIALTIALESLFNIESQELTFRMSTYIASFLEEDTAKKKRYFKKAQDVFKLRGTIVHGQPVKNKNIDDIMYDCEELLRRSYCKILLDKDILKTFLDNSKKIKLLFESKMF